MSALTVGELFTWARRVNASPRRLQAIEDFTMDIPVVDVDASVGRRFGELRAGQLDTGQRKPTADLWIAATALVHDLTLVTHNLQDFETIPALRTIDWLDS